MPEYHIYLGADHRGFEKKEALFPLLNECHENVIVEDLGAEEYNEDDDFNDPALAVAQAVAHDDQAFGVLLCGSAHGVCMQANRIPGARAINATTVESVVAGRRDDHANILCLAADELDTDTMEQLVKTLCHTRPSTDERYLRRIKRLDHITRPDHESPATGFPTKIISDDNNEDEEE